MGYNPDYRRTAGGVRWKCRRDIQGVPSPLLYSLEIINVRFLICPKKPLMHCIRKKFIQQLRPSWAEAVKK